MLKLYPAKLTEAQFEAGGNSICNLGYAVKPRVIQNINGDWSLSFTYPAGRIESELIKTDMLVLADGQLYRIEAATKSDNGGNETINVRAVHLFYDLRDRYIENIETSETTPGGINQGIALQQVLHGSNFKPGPTDPDVPILLDYLDILQKDVVWAIKEQVLPFWGGELYPDNWTINIKHRIGADRGVHLRQGKNIKGVRMEESLNGTITRLHIIGYNGANIESINDGKDYIDSPNINKYANIKEGYVTFSDDDLPEDLLSKGQEYLSTVDTPKITVSVDIPEIKGSTQYKLYKDLERVELGDVIVVYHKGLKININARVQRREYNPVSGENYRVDIGNDTNDLYSKIASIQQATEIIRMITDRKGHIRGERLRGVVDLLTTRLYASGSFTQAVVNDKTGLLFENVNSESVDYGAMYIGPGIFAISDEQDQNGTWIWRTFGTGQGFVGNELIAHSITANKLASDVGQSLDLSSNESITSLVESIGTLEDSVNDPQTGLTALGSSLSDVKDQLDGKIETFNQTDDPAAAWNTPELKASHIGDLWYHPTTNESKRWNGTSWKLLQDKEALAAKALATVKRRVFITQPTPPYDIADLWLTSTQANKADMMTCVIARASGNYTASDWMKLVKYTDDSYASTKYEQTNNAFRWLLGYGPAAGLDINNAQTYLGLDANGLKFVGNNVDISANETITLHADRINQKASQTEVNALTGRVESAESEILQTPEKISMAIQGIQVGGANLLRNSGQFQDTSGWMIEDGSGNETISVISSSSLKANVLMLGSLSVNYNLRTPISNSPIISGQTYTLSFVFSGNIPSSAVVHDSTTYAALSPTLTFPTREQVAGAFYLYKTTFVATAGSDSIRARISFPYEDATDYLGWVQLEKGSTATDWSSSKEDIDDKIDAYNTTTVQPIKNTANAKNRTYMVGGTTAPTGVSGAVAGDLWVDTDSNNEIKRFNGSSWVLAQNANLSSAVTRVTSNLTDAGIKNIVDAQVFTADGKNYQSLTEAITAVGQITNKVATLADGIPQGESIIQQTDSSINLAVKGIEVGGRNLIPNSGDFERLDGWSLDANSGSPTMSIITADSIGRKVIVINNITDTTHLRTLNFKGRVSVNGVYTLSIVCNGNRPSGVIYQSTTPYTGLAVHDFQNMNQDISWFHTYAYTFTAPFTAEDVRIRFSFDSSSTARYIIMAKLEKGNKHTDWSPATTDPANGVKVAGLDIGPGTFDAYASLAFNMLFGSGVNEFGMSNNRADKLGIWMGGNPSNAKNRQYMDGTVDFKQIILGNSGVNQFTQMYPYVAAENADSSNPVVIEIFIPAECSGIQSVKLSFKLKPYRAYSTGAASGGGSTSGSGGGSTSGANNVNNTGSATGNTGKPSTEYTGVGNATAGHTHSLNGHTHNLGSHTHDMNSHKHSVPSHTHTTPDHTHGITYGIYSGPTATSATLVVDGTTVGSYANRTAFDIVGYMSKTSGKVNRDAWHTIQLTPNALSRIEVQAFVIAVVQTATNPVY